MGRRGRNEGSIYQRPDGLWVGSLSMGFTAGKRRRRVLYGSTKTEVQQKLADARLELAASGGTPAAMDRSTVAEFMARWLEAGAKPTVKPNTYLCYSSTIRLYINPGLGAMPLAKVTPLHIQGLLADLTKDGKSARITQLTFAVLRRAFGRAVKWGLLQRNPVDGAEAPRYVRPKARVWSLDQVSAFLTAPAVVKDRLYSLFLLALTASMRQGELLGLQWTDLDLSTASVAVRHTLVEQNGHILGLDTPKSKMSNRVIALPDTVVSALIKHRERLLADGLAACPYVFPNTLGHPILKSNLTRVFHRLCAKAAVTRIPFHSLRHTSATWALGEGSDIKTLQGKLGHESGQLTLDTYLHFMPARDREIATRLDASLIRLTKNGGGK